MAYREKGWTVLRKRVAETSHGAPVGNRWTLAHGDHRRNAAGHYRAS
jgi:hypothetical protein